MTTQAPEVPAPQTFTFQAEIQQLLHLVINSLYTDKEIFIRELISNASDALEKMRHQFLVNANIPGADLPLSINIITNSEAKTVTFVDSGIGMTREELVQNLGTIAHSGTKKFLSQSAEAGKPADISLIGQFGVGFYSAFMVAKKVAVESKSYQEGAEGNTWESDGSGSYTVAAAELLPRGTKITLHLKDDYAEFAEDWKIKDIIHKFSNFIAFPLELNGEKVNSVQAIWTRSKADVTDAEYNEFYKFVSNDFDDPLYRFHFTADAPLAIKSLLFVGKNNAERLGFGRMEPGVDLYCKKVLIQKAPEKLLPEWMRFVRGVIDSDDLPLNISRETMQDSLLVRKLSKVITSRFIKFLAEESGKDEAAYATFFDTFGRFIKEGITSDFTHREELAKLVRFESSATDAGKTTSLPQYVARMKDGQTDIYYINGASRQVIESGPYIEALRERGYEVLYLFDQIDDFVLDNLGTFDGKKLLSADRGDLDLPELKKEGGLTPEQADALCGWLKELLGTRIGSVRSSKRLVNNPAVIVTDGSASSTMQRLFYAMNKDKDFNGSALSLELNLGHALVVKLADLRTNNEDFAKLLAEQLYDNALLGAGLLFDSRAMVERLNTLLAKAAGV